MSPSRRDFLSGTTATMVLGGTARAAHQRPRIAVLTTVYHKYSHAQHIVDRFLEGYGWEGRHHHPPMDVVSLYVQQERKDNFSTARTRRHPQMKIYPTIAEALTRGGKDLAVDGVLIICEHGSFPSNEKGQRLYPRFEYFQQVVEVYRASGRTAPVFNDKHLSWNWDYARQMFDTAKEMNFGFMAGSSLPVSWRLPSVDLPWGAEVEEAVGIWDEDLDAGDFHVLEALQAIVERRRGGETGVRAVEALQGERFWHALESGSWEKGGWDKQLLEAALCRSLQLTSRRPTYSHVLPTIDEIRRASPNSRAYRFEYLDGLKSTMIQFKPGARAGGIVGDCSVAARLRGGEVFSVLFYLSYQSLRNFFSPLVHHIETLFLTGQSPCPLERTLLTTGMTEAGIDSLHQNQKRIELPHLAIRYEPPRQSQFWRT